MDEWKSVHTDSCVPVRCKGPNTQDIARKNHFHAPAIDKSLSISFLSVSN